uniref:Uncharacterized protein n=1 Tax=Pyxicephalus adspersus TaxID=30357 RepID=A0AAV2ZVE8_PYXAD|nr:TPA: hypothetical protein GDO54_003346 [Pyxicephalus adspersus]
MFWGGGFEASSAFIRNTAMPQYFTMYAVRAKKNRLPLLLTYHVLLSPLPFVSALSSQGAPALIRVCRWGKPRTFVPAQGLSSHHMH